MRKMAFMLLFAASFLTACSSYNIYSVSKDKLDVTKYQTYAWMSGNESKLQDYYNNDIAEEKIIESANTALSSRGLKLNNKQPDILIRYTAVIDEKSRTVNEPVYYQSPYRYVPAVGYYRGRAIYYYRYVRPFPVYVGAEERKVEFEEGNIVIDLIDRKTSKVIWRGVAKGEVNNPENAVNDLPKVISKIFDKLPS
ncbi:DUF4136 domain-containing protein [Desertivirga xinjiangensis]|uniref:DUF4136 domain-containing protein n=1 Tax=Desertivirga xinjiangensis TaxID=539206 RepID=UPI00210AD426|nr:DUF4136 domain-containing protein [Pedobacter xinjiangensis]